MASKRAHNAKMNSKGLEDAVSDDEARQMIETQGGRSLFLVEAVHGKYETAIDGQQTINLIPGVVVRVPDEQAGPVRDLLRALAIGGPQALSYEDPGDAFVPPVADAQAGVQNAADTVASKAGSKAKTPRTTVKKTTAKKTAPKAETTKAGLSSVPPLPPEPDPGGEDAAGPWPGDEGYVEPGADG